MTSTNWDWQRGLFSFLSSPSQPQRNYPGYHTVSVRLPGLNPGGKTEAKNSEAKNNITLSEVKSMKLEPTGQVLSISELSWLLGGVWIWRRCFRTSNSVHCFFFPPAPWCQVVQHAGNWIGWIPMHVRQSRQSSKSKGWSFKEGFKGCFKTSRGFKRGVKGKLKGVPFEALPYSFKFPLKRFFKPPLKPPLKNFHPLSIFNPLSCPYLSGFGSIEVPETTSKCQRNHQLCFLFQK